MHQWETQILFFRLSIYLLESKCSVLHARAFNIGAQWEAKLPVNMAVCISWNLIDINMQTCNFIFFCTNNDERNAMTKLQRWITFRSVNNQIGEQSTRHLHGKRYRNINIMGSMLFFWVVYYVPNVPIGQAIKKH